MSGVVIALLAACAAVVQIGAAPPAFADRLAAPVLPVALIAAWASMRDPRETWPALVVSAVLLGVVSEARIGGYLLALLPTAAAAVLLAAAREERDRGTTSGARRLTEAAVAGAAGAAAYVTLLAIGDAPGVLPLEAGAIGAILFGAAWTGTVAVAIAAALWPQRSRSTGLFA